jgi:hypothetical protein
MKFLSDSLRALRVSFENRTGERSLTGFTLSATNGFKITEIVIPSGCEESFPPFFILGVSS